MNDPAQSEALNFALIERRARKVLRAPHAFRSPVRPLAADVLALLALVGEQREVIGAYRSALLSGEAESDQMRELYEALQTTPGEQR